MVYFHVKALSTQSFYLCDQSDWIPHPHRSLWNKPWAAGTCLSPSCGKRCRGETVWREACWPGGSNCDQRLTTQLWVSLHIVRQGDDDDWGLLHKTLMMQRQRNRAVKISLVSEWMKAPKNVMRVYNRTYSPEEIVLLYTLCKQRACHSNESISH